MASDKIFYSRDLKAVSEVRDTLTDQEALNVLVKELLGESWYITDPMGGGQANVLIVEEILRKYAPKKRL